MAGKKKEEKKQTNTWFSSNDTYKQLTEDISILGKKLETLKNKTQKETSEALSKIGVDINKFNTSTQIGIRSAKDRLAEFGKSLSQLKESAPDLSEAELKSKVQDFNASIKSSSQKSLENLERWYKIAAEKIKNSNADLETEANKIVETFESGLSSVKEKIKNSASEQSHSPEKVMDTLNTNVIDIRTEIAKLSGKVSAKEKEKLKNLLSTIEACYEELDYDLKQEKISLVASDRKVFTKLGKDIKKMHTTLNRVKGSFTKNLKSEVIPLFQRAEEECNTIKNGIQKIS